MTGIIGYCIVVSLFIIATHAQCPCEWDVSQVTCACCEEGECHCPPLAPGNSQLCVTCGQENTCPRDTTQDCDVINTQGCLFTAGGTRRTFSEAGLWCADREGHLPNIRDNTSWVDYQELAAEQQWGDVWTGARVRTFYWQWANTGSPVLLQGCFTDNPHLPNLSNLTQLDANVTAEGCISTCRLQGYRFAAVQLEPVSFSGLQIQVLPSCRCDDRAGFRDQEGSADVVYYSQPLTECATPCPSATEPGAHPCGALNKHLLFHLEGLEFEAWSDSSDDSGFYCAQLKSTEGSWAKQNCSLGTRHVCQYTHLNEYECGLRNWTWAGDRCVSVHTEALSWHAAQRHCYETGRGCLVQLESRELHDAVLSLINGTDSLWWIGLTNRPFTWTDGTSVTYMPWQESEPAFKDPHDACVVLDKERRYTAKLKRCNDRYESACQLVYNWTDAHSARYEAFYEQNADVAQGGSGGGNYMSSTAPPASSTTSASNPGSGGSNSEDNDNLYIGIGVGAAVIFVMVLLFIAFIIYHRHHVMHREKLTEGEARLSNAGFSGPGIPGRVASYRLTRQNTMYESIDDTYEYPANNINETSPYRDSGYMGLDPSTREADEQPRDAAHSPAPQPPPLRPDSDVNSNGYAQLGNHGNDYVTPSAYTGLEARHVYKSLKRIDNSANAKGGSCEENVKGAANGGLNSTVSQLNEIHDISEGIPEASHTDITETPL